MRLETFVNMDMRYSSGSWHRPYTKGAGPADEGIGFGQGEGELSGEIEGTMVWANFPRRRQDGVWTPNLRGRITTAQGEEILVSIHGQSILEETPGQRRAILARVELTTESERYRWLNTCFLIGEGEIDEEKEEWWMTTYVCVNQIAEGAPALGSEPPERYRQVGRSRS
jgi:hypothetical protein